VARPRRQNASRQSRKRRTVARTQPRWATWSDDELLELRFCDLGLRVAGTPIERQVARLHRELEQRGLRFRPHVWLSTEWFSPDGVPGIAVPFYLAHPRLAELEERQVFDVEGGTPVWCMQLLRHEAAHAIDCAYELHRRRDWRQTFGRYSAPYLRYYRPKPYSRSFVQHLDMWYAQSHPAEDWAETFAVWLDPKSNWRKRYRDWPAVKKLEYVDRLMDEIDGTSQKVRSRVRVEELGTLDRRLKDHYVMKKKRYGLKHPHFYDADLRRLFPPLIGMKGKSAASFLRRLRPELRRAVSRWTGEYQYTVDRVIEDMIERCSELDMRYSRSEYAVRQDAVVLLAVQTMNYLYEGHHRLVR
jgi:hypothetical protein